jgi:hypothetical protein
LSRFIREDTIELAELKRGFIPLVLDADDKASGGPSLLHDSVQ